MDLEDDAIQGIVIMLIVAIIVGGLVECFYLGIAEAIRCGG